MTTTSCNNDVGVKVAHIKGYSRIFAMWETTMGLSTTDLAVHLTSTLRRRWRGFWTKQRLLEVKDLFPGQETTTARVSAGQAHYETISSIGEICKHDVAAQKYLLLIC